GPRTGIAGGGAGAGASGDRMVERRAFMGVLAGGRLAAPSAAETQQAGRVYRIGVVLQGGPYFADIDGLRDGLKELGLVEGKHFELDVRDTKGDLTVVESAARALEQKDDLIYSITTSATLAAKLATQSVPIWFYSGTDPVAIR